ncbi:bifunctional diaminohydroxyphosphoribosylaminopyrimidine deaminase/5-amino-6-(5-phosphoribosylamino)uracil reductase RibD [Pollutibacter soli]|uniref:bifunctional diaminohydroxyphosphoribosylaminopyrimidine deaminase/5-amino-6-(5-phosphoribosylamino)uracil reductase RibD n=1 Tax=Pollutibacter soli TaxID=3034157 RepID=UPI003013BFAA
MSRCLQLAVAGAGSVAPNPMVGAVLVYNDIILGEGYHQNYGGPHAEVNCFESVGSENRKYIPDSTLYVSLEPCSHYGKTPPCADLIIREGVKRVVIGMRDPFESVDGRGIEKLKNAGIEVVFPVLESEAGFLNRRFVSFQKKHRPYIILKWAQTADGFIGSAEKRLHISGMASNRLVHKWRSEEAAILVGVETVLHDDPQLTTRLWPGKNPVRMIIDPKKRLPDHLRVFDGECDTIVFTNGSSNKNFRAEWIEVGIGDSFVDAVCRTAFERKLQSILVEGGSKTIQHFLDTDLWDEIRMITNTGLFIGEGIAAPFGANGKHILSEQFGEDRVDYFLNPGNPLAAAGSLKHFEF